MSLRYLIPATLTPLVTSFSLGAAPEWESVREILADTCHDCHNTRKNKGGVDLERLESDPSVEAEFALWEKVREVVARGEMPPEDETQPTESEKKSLLAWVDGQLEAVAAANAGDPGPVTLRRLTNEEYDRTIRDLTGVDFGLAAEFQPDGGGGEGFSNTGDTLFVNPSQLDKYLAAARALADHATILPGSGIQFHPQRVGPRSADQVKDQAQQALYVWYQKMAEPHLPGDEDDFREADYMLACWKWRHRELTGARSLDDLAEKAGLKSAFLANWWRMLNEKEFKSRFLDLTRAAWRELPPPAADDPRAVPAPVMAALRDIQAQRRSWNLPKAGAGVQRRQQDADGLRAYRLNDPLARTRGDQSGWGGSGAVPETRAPAKPTEVHLVLGDLGDGNAGDYVQISDLTVRMGDKNHPYAPFMRGQRNSLAGRLKEIEAGEPLEDGEDVAWIKREIARIDKALAHFGKDPLGKDGVAKDVLAARAPVVITLPLPEGASGITGSGKLDMRAPDVDQATVQWTLVAGPPPDPGAIVPGVITIWKRQTDAARNTMADFTRMKSAFPDTMERRLEEVARNFQRGSAGPGVYYFSDEQLLDLLDEREKKRFQQMREDWGFVSPAKLPEDRARAYDERVIAHLRHFASLAWRRPLKGGEAEQIGEFYRQNRARELDREGAARECLAFILVSPKFLYKTEIGTLGDAGDGVETPLDAWEIASRLSYFIWSSLPDWQLRQAAADGSLLTSEGRAAQALRMLRDPKAGALATEFAGQWLEFKGFESHTAVDEKKFPEFNEELRADMTRETALFFTHLIRQDRPVHEILTADYTFLNERLAVHYGVPGVTGAEFVKVSVPADRRGGLLGQGSVLTKTSRSHRTSPVLRGNWLLEAVLGTPVPPPPSDVPELPEHSPEPASMREMLERHRDFKACSGCHDRIDPLGFALENFDPIGRWRDNDEAGLPLDTSASVKGGEPFNGFAGLREHLRSRQPQFALHFSRKLLGYALGRRVLPTDKALIREMQADAADGGKFSDAILRVIESRQFLRKRN